MNVALYEYLTEVLGRENVLEQEPMRRHTTFQVGGEAEYFAKIQEKSQLITIMDYLRKTEQPYFVLGNGSNILVSDKGYEGVILDLSAGLKNIEIEGKRVTAEAGALLSTVAVRACEADLAGFEFAAGIPGTIGGAIVMNAGAYDGEMKQVVESVTVLGGDGEIMVLDNETMEFGYRSSIIKNRPFIVMETVLRLEEGDKEQIKGRMEELNKRRREKQPLNYPSAGSTFKRPEGHFAGKLIMDAGLRGFRIGGARVSEKHCGFVINEGNATATDVADVIDEVIERVRDKFGVTLETEIIKLGDF
ncbi:MAG: UDP-N-acetylmuramate dehydrogenase [Lachnospiraceae bacterium]|nr:UDP-N-acetylmuramate dehydrogenase [Lachnospiraceae bacterium]